VNPVNWGVLYTSFERAKTRIFYCVTIRVSSKVFALLIFSEQWEDYLPGLKSTSTTTLVSSVAAAHFHLLTDSVAD